MQHVGGALHLSASDLIGHLNCRYLTALDLAVANGALAGPNVWDPVLEVLAERGALHEKGYVEHLKADGLSVMAIEGFGVATGAVAQTLEAMKAGVPIIVRGALQAGPTRQGSCGAGWSRSSHPRSAGRSEGRHPLSVAWASTR
jgi:hypothetical protein